MNWFRKDADGKFLWPGYGENSRVLAWVFGRCAGDAGAVDTAIGRAARAPDALPVDGLALAPGRARRAARRSTRTTGGPSCRSIEEHYAMFGDRLPPTLHDELDALAKRLAEQP